MSHDYWMLYIYKLSYYNLTIMASETKWVFVIFMVLVYDCMCGLYHLPGYSAILVVLSGNKAMERALCSLQGQGGKCLASMILYFLTQMVNIATASLHKDI